MTTAGVVTYKIGQDGSLRGHWTHRDLEGRMGTERAWGGIPGQLAGSYDVEIETPDKRKIFEGSLGIATIGEAYALTWTGRQLLPLPRDAKYSGIGTVERGDMLVSTFQEDESPGRASMR
jgi:hypothetical protein